MPPPEPTTTTSTVSSQLSDKSVVTVNPQLLEVNPASNGHDVPVTSATFPVMVPIRT